MREGQPALTWHCPAVAGAVPLARGRTMGTWTGAGRRGERCTQMALLYESPLSRSVHTLCRTTTRVGDA